MENDIASLEDKIERLEGQLDDERARGLPHWAYVLTKAVSVWEANPTQRNIDALIDAYGNVPHAINQQIRSDRSFDDFLDVLRIAAKSPPIETSYDLGVKRNEDA